LHAATKSPSLSKASTPATQCHADILFCDDLVPKPEQGFNAGDNNRVPMAEKVGTGPQA